MDNKDENWKRLVMEQNVESEYEVTEDQLLDYLASIIVDAYLKELSLDTSEGVD